jgi:hypothetical protein
VADIIHVDLTQLPAQFTPLEQQQLQSMQKQLQSGSVLTWELDIKETKKNNPPLLGSSWKLHPC